MPNALAALAGQALKQILTHQETKARPKEFNPLPESRAAHPTRLVRLAAESSLTQSIHQIAACLSSGWELVRLVVEN
jgi:hypothetical protein